MIHPHPAAHTLLLLAGAVASAGSAAQPVAQPDGLWRTWINLGLTNASGNTEAATLTLKADAVRATADDRWTLYGEALRARTDGVTSGDRTRLGGRYDWNLTPRLFSFGSLDAERDTLAEQAWRAGVGAGLGFKLIDREELRFSTFGGMSFTTDRYTVPRLVDGEMRTRFDRPAALRGFEQPDEHVRIEKVVAHGCLCQRRIVQRRRGVIRFLLEFPDSPLPVGYEYPER